MNCSNRNDWIGRQELAQDTVTPAPVAALSATLDLNSARPQEGVMPPVPLPRRMWAASQLAFHVPI